MRRWWLALVDRVLLFLDRVADEGLLRLLVRRSRRLTTRVRLPPGLVIFVLAGAIGTALWFVPLWLARDLSFTSVTARLSYISDTRTTLIQVVGASGLLAGLFYTARTFRLNHSVSVLGQYSRAIEQLGSLSDGVRLAGVLELELMADKSLVDYTRVARLLRTFIIEQVNATGNMASEELRSRPRESLVAALQAMGSHPRWPWSIQSYPRADLRHLDLSRISFRYAQLGGSQWDRSNLGKASFTDADLTSASFVDANLTDARLEDANLTDADLTRADLSGANFKNAVLWRAKLEGATLKGAKLDGAKLHRGALTSRQWSDVSSAFDISRLDSETPQRRWS